MDVKKLIGVLIALLLIYFVIDWTNSKGDQSFDPTIVTVDTSLVDRMEIRIKDQPNPVVLTKANNSWLIKEGEKSGLADPSRVVNILTQIEKIEALRYASKKKEKWSEYEIDSNATQVMVYQGENKLTDFFVGRFAFNQQARSGTSYIRLAESEEVYAVDGFISVSFSPGIDAYRDKKLWTLQMGGIEEVNFMKNNLIAKNNISDGWDYESLGVDSIQWSSYLQSVSSLQAQNFEYQSDPISTEPLIGIKSIEKNIQVENGVNQTGELVLKVSSNGRSSMINDKDSVIYKRLLEPIRNEQ